MSKFFPLKVDPSEEGGKTKIERIASLATGFIRVREMSGKCKIFQGQGIVRGFHNLSGKIEFC